MVLIVYKSSVYQEYFLSNNENGSYTVFLDKSTYGFVHDVLLQFDVNNGIHCINETENYKVSCKSQHLKSCVLENGMILTISLSTGEAFTAIVADRKPGFNVLKKYDLSKLDYISIGTDSSNLICYNFNDLVSKYHCEIRKENNAFYVNDISVNGVFCNYQRVPKRYRLSFGDEINIFGLHIVCLADFIGIGTAYGDLSVDSTYLIPLQQEPFSYKEIRPKITDEKDYFSRSPRVVGQISKETIEIEAPPAPRFTKKKPVLYTIGPAFTMAIPMMLGSMMAIISSMSGGRMASSFMYTGIFTALGSAAVGVIWGLLNMRYARRSEAEEEQERFNSYGNYLLGQVNIIRGLYEQNVKTLNNLYPSSSECCRYDRYNTMLWNRNHSHSDFLFYRLGIGDIPFQVSIQVPKKKFSVTADSLSEKAELIKHEYETLKNVPVGVDLFTNKLYGIIGGKDKRGAMEVMYSMVAQIVANNCYTDVKLVFIYNQQSPKDIAAWEFARWLPHVWSEDKKTRYLASNKIEASDVFYELTNILRARSEKSSVISTEKKSVCKPYYILFIDDIKMLEGELIGKYVLGANDAYGITTIILSEEYTDLPNECSNIIQNDDEFCGSFDAMDVSGKKESIVFDKISATELSALARRLSEVTVNEIESSIGIPSRLDFLEMYSVATVSELEIANRWRKNRTFNSMAALVGKKSGGMDCFLDIHEKFHGPHGLVAGTTGSGKSELLQTYILSLAINYSPEDVAIFIIDYKGGGMANLFSDLPHMAGQISNLSGNQVHRAMISIKSENVRRQCLFNECGVNGIGLYTRLYKNGEVKTPIPHLFIIIDEFAELKKEEPDFMRELISVAQVGRSLGVHLILATQKPSGTVDDNIWSNSKFRLCLRVQDRQDSNDMLHKPDAAYITQAGRAYLQVGNDEIYELFQSGWSGAPYNEEYAKNFSETSKMIQTTGKTALVGNNAQIRLKEREKKEWYKGIAACVLSVLSKLSLNSVEDLRSAEHAERSALMSEVIAEMTDNGMDYSDNTGNRSALENYVLLWPGNTENLDDVAKAVSDAAISKGIKLPEKREKTQLEVIVKELNRVAVKEEYTYKLKLWLPVLPKEISLAQLTSNDDAYFDGREWRDTTKSWTLIAPVGLYDDPVNQAQLPLYVDFAQNGHLAVCGMVSTGKSTFLQTLIYSFACKYSPKALSIYSLDFSNNMLLPFENLPHCGGIIRDQNIDRVGKFFHMLAAEMELRKQLFGGGNYAQYIRVHTDARPAWLIVIDNYAGFREKTNNEYEDMILRIVKEGIGYGIYLAVTAGSFGINEIPNRIGDNIRTVISLEMGDRFKYMEIMRTTRISTVPEVGVKGRGLAYVDKEILEFHTALALQAPDDFSRGQLISSNCEKMKAAWHGACADTIPEIPAEPKWKDISALTAFLEAADKDSGHLPFAYLQDDASVYSISLASTYCYSITGKPRTGKTNVMKALIKSAALKCGRIAVFEKQQRELKKITEECSGEYLNDDESLYKFLLSIKNDFVNRNKTKIELVNEGFDDEQIYDSIRKETPIFIFISDMMSFVKSVYHPSDEKLQMKVFVENITDKGFLHNIYFFACIDTDASAAASTYLVYKNFTRFKSGIHLGGNINSQRIFNFQNIPYNEQGKAMKIGVGLVPSANDEAIADVIVLPKI